MADSKDTKEKNPAGKKYLSIRFDEAHYAIIKAKAEKSGMSLSEFIRRSALGKEVKERIIGPDQVFALEKLTSVFSALTRYAKEGEASGVNAAKFIELGVRYTQVILKSLRRLC